MKGTISPDMLRGNTDAVILQLLSLKDSYGYEVYKAIIEITGEAYELKEATLYASFKRLEKDGRIESYWGNETLGGRRKYYKITADGLSYLEQCKADWRFTVNVINSLLGVSSLLFLDRPHNEPGDEKALQERVND
jgi:DNA-binding PadR family transcriptional regulator